MRKIICKWLRSGKIPGMLRIRMKSVRFSRVFSGICCCRLPYYHSRLDMPRCPARESFRFTANSLHFLVMVRQMSAVIVAHYPATDPQQCQSFERSCLDRLFEATTTLPGICASPSLDPPLTINQPIVTLDISHERCQTRFKAVQPVCNTTGPFDCVGPLGSSSSTHRRPFWFRNNASVDNTTRYPPKLIQRGIVKHSSTT